MKLLKSITLASALYLSSCAAPQIRDNTIQASVPIPDEARVPNEQRPSYLTSLPPTEELGGMSPVDKLVLQYIQNARDMQNNMPGLLLTNGSPRRAVTINGANVSIELPYYRQEGNQIRNILDGSIDNQDTVFLDIENIISRANNIAFENFQQIDENANRRVEQRAGNIDESSAVEELDGITLGTVLGIQHHTRASLLPKKFILGNLDGSYAITRLHENVIVYSPMARQVDEIWGHPAIVVHEFWHIAQNIVDAFGTNVELYAYSANLRLANSNPLMFLLHPYGAEARELAETYYGFDAQQVISNSIKNRITNLVELDEDALAGNYQNISQLANRFGNVLHNEVEPEYRSFSPYWAIMQEYYRNKNLLLRLAIAKDGVPVGMSRAERARFLVQKRQALEQIFAQVNSEYVPPRIIEFGPLRIVDGITIEDLIAKKCHDAGFDEAQADYTFHLFLKKTFFNGNGTYNYSNISLSNAAISMHNFTERFDITESEFDRYFPNSTPEVRRLFSQYKWYSQRLETALRYNNFAKLQGLAPENSFVPGIFDPRFSLEGFYQIRPGYTMNTANASLRSTSLVRTNGIEYRVNNYDLVNNRGNPNGVDYISVFRVKQNGQPETNPCLILFAGNNSQAPNFALIDNDREGQVGYGIYDAQTAVTENTTIESLLTAPVITATLVQQNQAQPQHGHFVPPDYSSWQSRMEEYDADLDSKIDSIAVFYHNGGRQVRELYQIPVGYDGAFITEQGIMLSKRGLFEIVQLDSLNEPYALQITENGSIRTLFDNNGHGIYRQMVTSFRR